MLRRDLTLKVSDAELAARAAAQPVVQPQAERGYRQLFLRHVTQADRGVDFDFLQPAAHARLGAVGLSGAGAGSASSCCSCASCDAGVGASVAGGRLVSSRA